jgi:hypothetical protein
MRKPAVLLRLGVAMAGEDVAEPERHRDRPQRDREPQAAQHIPSPVGLSASLENAKLATSAAIMKMAVREDELHQCPHIVRGRTRLDTPR